MLPSQVGLFTSFIYRSYSPSLYLQKLLIEDLHPQTAELQKQRSDLLAFSEGGKKEKERSHQSDKVAATS